MNRKRVVFIIVFSVLIMGIFGVMMAHELKNSDFPAHIAWAKQYGEVGYLNKIPHTLFSKLVVIIRALLPANILVRVSVLAKQVYDLKSYEISAWILMEISYLATAFFLLKIFIREWKRDEKPISLWLAGVGVFIVLLVGPIFFLTYPEQMYVGYFSPNPYHNPTYILFRPIVLIILYAVANNLFAKWNWKQSGIITLAIICASLAKPSFTLTFLPTVGLLIVLGYLKKFTKINWLYVIFPLGLVSVVVLASQYYINYSGYWGDQIQLVPFMAMLTYVPNIPLVLLYALLSILFPALISIFYWKKNASRISFQLVWLNFFVAFVLASLVGEKADLASNNFGWGVMIAVFLLFVEGVLILGKELVQKGLKTSAKSWKMIIPSAALILHLICGIIYFITCLSNNFALVK